MGSGDGSRRLGRGEALIWIFRWRLTTWYELAGALGAVAERGREGPGAGRALGGEVAGSGPAGAGGSRLPQGGLEAPPGHRLERPGSCVEPKSKRGVSQDLASSPKLDRCKIARQLVEKAVRDKKIFSIYGHYPVVRAALRRKGWVEKKLPSLPKGAPGVEDAGELADGCGCVRHAGHKDVALENIEDIHEVMSRLVKNETPYFLWTIKRDVIDYHSLTGDQMLNHYGKTASFTTKVRRGPGWRQAGASQRQRKLTSWVPQDSGSEARARVSPAAPQGTHVLVRDFRLTVAASILKWVVGRQNRSRSKPRSSRAEAGDRDPGSGKDPEDAEAELRGLPGQLVDTACRVCQAYLGRLEHEDIDMGEDAEGDLTEAEWSDLTQQYYTLVHGDAFISNSKSYFQQCQALLSKISAVNPQTEIDGLHNIWIVKPAAKSRGRDIVCMNHVEDILGLAAADHAPPGDKWVVQKYIETPLLICDTKFDIRQWFLVTDWNPLTVWFYKDSYLRFSTQRFSLDNLDGAVHLCNHSIQRGLRHDQDRSPLLPGHNMWTSTRFCQYLQTRGCGAAWGRLVYPAMKRAVAHAMRVAQDHVEPRKNSFELFGADFVLGRDLRPWLIEINSGPTMRPSTPVTAQLCAQVQEDTLKVVLDRKLDHACDVGNFELLWRQPTVDPPPFSGPNLGVQGTGVGKARQPTPPVCSPSTPAPLSDTWPRPARCPRVLLDPILGPPQCTLQRDPRRKEAQERPSTLRVTLPRPAPGRGASSPTHAQLSGEMALPACHCQNMDKAAPGASSTHAQSAKCLDPSLLHRHALEATLPSVETAGALHVGHPQCQVLRESVHAVRPGPVCAWYQQPESKRG
ncbi:protein monoglycylase TTLL8 [Carlito syrichta]|uniref:Protein monoglycylase TTLL8 n=1 Tax=Carlito syrichta TaxID=1868482 RepID=A0A1U7SH03_CARSF|nr:protein monoglycylase TTLL8 [Carlito syrichta]